jgi:hypothetical protein
VLIWVSGGVVPAEGATPGSWSSGTSEDGQSRRTWRWCASCWSDWRQPSGLGASVPEERGECSGRFAKSGTLRGLAVAAHGGHHSPVSASPFNALVGHEVDTVSFVRDYVELRVDYSIVRFLTDPSGSIGGDAWQLTDSGGADTLRRYIGCTVVATEFNEDEHLRLLFNNDAFIHASLREEDRSGPEALHFMPADADGRVHSGDMWVW